MNRWVVVTFIACVACSSSEDEEGGGLSDTCTQGDNMTAPRLEGAPEASGSETKVRIAWDRGTMVGEELPAAYFEQAKAQDAKVVTRTAPAGERAMDVFLSGAPAFHAGKTETFTLEFPDRARFTSCRHSGMNDVYELVVTITFAADGATATATFEQKIDFGAI